MRTYAPNAQRLADLIGNAMLPAHLADTDAAVQELRRIWKLEGNTAPHLKWPAGVQSDQYPSVDAYRNSTGAPKARMVKLLAINDIVGGFGIEWVETESTREYMDYINTGDSYAPTVAYWRGQLKLLEGGIGGLLEGWKGPKFR